MPALTKRRSRTNQRSGRRRERRWEREQLRFLGWGEFDEEMVFALRRMVDDERCLQAFLQDVQGLVERGVGGGGPGLLALAVFDGAAGDGLGFHQDVEHAQFPFG
jgi:hypothetical protein